MDDELDEVLSYDAFLNRQLRRAWEQRWRAHQWNEYVERSRAASAAAWHPSAESGGTQAHPRRDQTVTQ